MKFLFGKSIKEFDYNLFLEKWYPSLISVLIVIIYLLFKPVLVADNLDSILNAVISFTSILLGFIGVLITLIFSLINISIVGEIFKDEFHRKQMHNYFRRCIQAGFILIGVTILLFFRNTISQYLYIQVVQLKICIIDFIKIGWIFLTPYFSLVSYRIISLVLRAAFEPAIEGQNENTENEDAEDYTDIREKHKI